MTHRFVTILSILILSIILMNSLYGMHTRNNYTNKSDKNRPLSREILAYVEKVAATPLCHPAAPITLSDLGKIPSSDMRWEILNHHYVKDEREEKKLKAVVDSGLLKTCSSNDRRKLYVQAFRTILHQQNPLNVLLPYLLTQPVCARRMNYANSPADYSNDGTLLAIGNQHRVSFWDTEKLSCLRTIIHDDQEAPITCVSFNPTDSNEIFTSTKNIHYLWNHPEKTISETFFRGATAISWHDAGNKYVFVPSQQPGLDDTADTPLPITWKNVTTNTTPQQHKRILAVAYHNDAPLTIHQTWQRQVDKPLLYTTELGMDVKTAQNQTKHISNIILKGPHLTAATYDTVRKNIALISPHAVYIRSLESEMNACIALFPDRTIQKAIFSPTGKYLITASCSTKTGSNFISFWDIEKNKCMFTFGLPEEVSSVYSIAAHPNGNQLFTGCDQHGYVWNFEKKEDLIEKLSLLNAQQLELMEGFAQAIKDRARIHPNDEQWETFKSLPEDFQEKLKLYIKDPKSVRK